MTLLMKWIVSGLAVLATAYLLPGVALAGFAAALVVALVLGVLNAFLKPLLLLLTLPVNILTLGLFSFVINALLILLASAIVPGFKVDGFLTALLFGIVLAVISYVIDLLIPGEKAHT